jgi:hypothetical protein
VISLDVVVQRVLRVWNQDLCGPARFVIMQRLVCKFDLLHSSRSGEGTASAVPHCLLRLSFRAGFSPRGICSSLLLPTTVIPSGAERLPCESFCKVESLPSANKASRTKPAVPMWRGRPFDFAQGRLSPADLRSSSVGEHSFPRNRWPHPPTRLQKRDEWAPRLLVYTQAVCLGYSPFIPLSVRLNV